MLPPPVTPEEPPGTGETFIVGTNVCIPLNGSAILDCTVQSGSPEVSYEWTRDFIFHISTDVRIMVDMPGNYTCNATNDFGYDAATSVVIGALFSLPTPNMST